MHPHIQNQVNMAVKAIEDEVRRSAVDMDRKTKFGRESTITEHEDGIFVDMSIASSRIAEGPEIGQVKQSGGSIYASGRVEPRQTPNRS